MRNRPTKEDRAARQDARWEIIQAANKFRVARRFIPVHHAVELWGMSQLQRAVHIARKEGLVKAYTLIAAGFNPTPK